MLNLYAENMLGEQTPLTYPSKVDVYKDIEIGEVIEEGGGYSNYAITPELPADVVFDQIRGWILGRTQVVMGPTT